MKYPIGTQSFEKLRDQGFVYVDKTDLVYKLVKGNGVYFLSRPRRFGKSLLLSTIKAYFEGKKELFKGLAIEQLEKDWFEYPIFTVDFNGSDFTEGDTLKEVIESTLKEWERIYGKNPDSDEHGKRFAYVLKQACEKTGRRAVVLIDEYDKPLLDVMATDSTVIIDGKEKRTEVRNRELLKGFYSAFKANDDSLQFVMLTGVTKFSQVSVFSGFNQPNDISMDEKYESICGITTEELHTVFEEPIKELANKLRITVEETKARLKKRYDGYHFSTNMEDIYNPFSILNCFSKLQFSDYWFSTGSPSYLVRLLNTTTVDVREMVDEEYEKAMFIDYKADEQAPLPMIYQSGYLTIKAFNPKYETFKLDFPNDEVRRGFTSALASNYMGVRESTVTSQVIKSVKKLDEGDIDGFITVMTTFMADIPYSMRRGNSEKEYEKYFHLIFYLTLRLIATYTVFTEKQQSQGRCDCIIETDNYVYVIEFKLDGTADEALKQIEDKGYSTPYLADNRKLFKLGAVFSSEKGTIAEYKVS